MYLSFSHYFANIYPQSFVDSRSNFNQRCCIRLLEILELFRNFRLLRDFIARNKILAFVHSWLDY